MNEVDKLVARLGWQCVQLDMALQQANQEIANLREQLAAKQEEAASDEAVEKADD